MINSRPARVAAIVLATTATTACANPATPAQQPPSAPATVPAGCSPTDANVQWSKPTTESRLTAVSLFRTKDDFGSGEEVLHEPFTPAVTQLAAPPEWIPQLAKSLSAKTGKKVQDSPARAADGGYSLISGSQDDPSITESLFYTGAELISATFTIACTPAVTGTFTSWTSAGVGGVTCAQFEPPAEPLGRLARRFCPRTPTAAPPSEDAIPFVPDPTG
ncbi:hypothetical protein [Paractinoplanes durhamensis]|uniref:Uncharacterized protein n=1 Tax=Paractinoplanes durhamensis TaxID=113563 RepID=A0ABQ3Z525_9ACTN|nr:hypothetical protein [Actinoplanes durhamensis]GIE04937.1 hypothetical protein Adu01nite_62870 [Actinoplanes durhamensis]